MYPSPMVLRFPGWTDYSAARCRKSGRAATGTPLHPAPLHQSSRIEGGRCPDRLKRPSVQCPMDRVGVVEGQILAGEFRFRRLVRFRFGWLPASRRSKRRDGGRTDIFGWIEIELHQRHVRAARILLEDRASDQSGLRVDRAPFGETARQNLKRQYRGRYQNEAFVGFLRAPGR